MKKSLATLFSFILAIVLVLGSFGTASAEPGDDPTVTPVSGDMEITTEIVPIVNLPGTHELANQMLAPVGFPDGEAQYGGNGIRVSGFSTGKATVCFHLNASAVQMGWGGKVGVWNGKKWVLLATTITTPDESPTSYACASISGNGTYAFIQYVAEPDKLPTMGECVFDVDIYPTGYQAGGGEGYTTGWMTGVMLASDQVLTGLPVSVRLLRTDPDGHLIMDGTGYGILFQAAPGVYITVFEDFLWWTEQNSPYYSWTFYVTIGNCFKIIDFVPQQPQEV